MNKQLESVSHDYIRYANCWEDADVLIKGLAIKEGERILSIGSAGDNSFSMLTCNPKIVVAVDINPVQLKLIELKKAAISALDHNEYLEFAGFLDSSVNRKLELFKKVEHKLDSNLRAFWNNRLHEVGAGIIHQGKFEKYFNLFNSRILPKIHTTKRIAMLFEVKNATEQEQFFKSKWNNLRWRLLFRIFFSRFILGRFGRDPKFMNEVQGSVSSFIIGQSARHLSSKNCQKNYFLHYILTGEFGKYLPHYARYENYILIKTQLEKLITFEGFAEKAFDKFGKFDKFNLSNIFEYMDQTTFEEVTANIVKNSTDHARFAYWNLMVPRTMSSVNKFLTPQHDLSKKLTKLDNGFFYGDFHVDRRHE